MDIELCERVKLAQLASRIKAKKEAIRKKTIEKAKKIIKKR